MGTAELSTEGRIVLVHIEFEDVNDKGKKKRGVIVNPIDGWYHKIEEECETGMLIPLR